MLGIDASGVRVQLPAARAAVPGRRRPRRRPAGEGAAAHRRRGGRARRHRARAPARVDDVSFCGVSTEYIVRVPGVGPLVVFAQNLAADMPVAPATRCWLTWSPQHAFASAPAGPRPPTDRRGAAARGRRGGDAPLSPSPPSSAARVRPASSAGGAGSPGCCSRRACSTSCCSSSRRWRCCCCLSFFERVPGGAVGQTAPAFRIANYTEAIAEYAPQFGRSFLFALHRDRARAADRLSAGVRHRGARPRPPAAAGPDARAGHRAVLHLLPPAHARLEADPRRRERGRHRAQGGRVAGPTTPG